MEKETLFYRYIQQRELKEDKNNYQLILCAGDISLVLGNFKHLNDMEGVVQKYFPGTKLEKFSKKKAAMKKSSLLELDKIHLPLQGNAPRKLSWGMSRKKVARIEQIDGGEHLLMKDERLHGHEVNIQFGFDEWAHCGLEYIGYSSPEPGFLNLMQEELNRSYGNAERVVDYQRLDLMLQDGKIEDEETLIRFIKNPESHGFNRFVDSFRGLTFRSALKWSNKHTACLVYNKRKDSRGERNKHNRSHVVEFWPSVLFDFYQEQFAELYLPV